MTERILVAISKGVARFINSPIKSFFMKASSNYKILFSATLILLMFWSCERENPEPGTPVFIKVDSFDFSAAYGTQGTERQKIVDTWIFADGANVGVFELPVTVPVLKEGRGELRIEAGILINGIASTRINNPFFEPVIISDFLFEPDSMISLTPATTYRSTTIFKWLEDFEAPSISLDTTNLGSTAGIVRVSGQEAYEGSYSGLIVLNDERQTFEAATFDAFELPVTGQPILLEMNYKNNHKFAVGIIAQSTSQIIKSDIIILNPSEEWNKIYINFTDKVRQSNAAIDFKVLIRSYVEEGEIEEARIYLDNLKLMHR